MVDYFLSKRSFEEYRVHTQGFLLINIEEVMKQMKHLTKETKIKALVDGKDAKFTISLVDTRERQRTLPMLEVNNSEIPPVPKLTLNRRARVTVIASDLYTDLEDMGNVSDHVTFEADYRTFRLKAIGDSASGKNDYKLGEAEGIVLNAEGDGDNRAVYSLSYLKALIRKDISEIIVFEWSKDMPLKITHENILGEDSKIIAYLAPRIEVEE